MLSRIARCAVFLIALSSPSLAQDLPSSGVVIAIRAEIGVPSPVTAAFSRLPNGMTNAQCRMHKSTVTLSRNGVPRTFQVLLDPQPGNSSARPKEMLTVLTRLQVDLDGSGRAYNPDAPYGRCNPSRTACALDRLANGGIRVFSGANLTETPEPDSSLSSGAIGLEPIWQQMWPLIRDAQIPPIPLTSLYPEAPEKYYVFHSTPKNATVVFNRNIIPSDARGYPCRHGDNTDHPGYFVAATTLTRDGPVPDQNRCKSSLYLDAEQIPFFVIPQGDFGSVNVGDVVVGHFKTGARERLAYGIVGDTGPHNKMGEGSLFFNRVLFDVFNTPMREEIETWQADQSVKDWNADHPNDRGTISILVLGNTRQYLNNDFSRDNIQAVAAARFALWNQDSQHPRARLNACVSQAAQNPERTLPDVPH